MYDYKTIIVAVDLAGGDDQVLKKAASLSGNSARVVMINVGDFPVHGYFPIYGGDMAPPETQVIDTEQLRTEVLSEMKKRATNQGVSVDRFVYESGRPVEKIIELAERETADLLVLGSHGRHGLGLLLGSTASGVLHRAPCDVLTVRIAE